MTWKAINDTLNRHKTKTKFPETFKLLNGQIISDPKEIATAFNDYFISIGEMEKVAQQPNCHFTNYLSNKPKCNLQFHPIDQTDVAQIIDNLKPKTSTGIDNISSKLLKQTKNSITAPLRGSTAIRHSTNYNFFFFFNSKTCLFSFETSFMTY